MTPYFQDAHVTLYCADFRDVLQALATQATPSRFDAIVTDCPYGETALQWDRWVPDWPSVVAPWSDQLWCFGSFRMFVEHAAEFHASPWKLAQDVVWEKQNGSGFNVDRFLRVHELIAHWYQGPWSSLHIEPQTSAGQPRPSARIGARTSGVHRSTIAPAGYEYTETRAARSVIYQRNCHGAADNETQKPEELAATLIRYSTPPGGVVFDPFAGSGTTGAAARRLGRQAVLVELREDQCAKIVDRLCQQTLELNV